MRLRALSGNGWVALLSLVLGFVVSLSFSSTATVNGVRTQCTYVDVAPFVIAIAGFFAGRGCLYNRGDDNRDRRLETVAGYVGYLAAAIHTLRGVLYVAGAIGPCA